jgi:heme-degrading monooxygenase HmoA
MACYLMILEHATLNVKSGRERAFETAFSQAKTIIASMSGYADSNYSDA